MLRALYTLRVRTVFSEAFTIAVRRHLARERSTLAVATYATEASEREPWLRRNARARRAEFLLQAALGTRDIKVSGKDGQIALTLLIDIVDSQSLSSHDVDDLLHEAEARACRRGKIGRRRTLWRVLSCCDANRISRNVGLARSVASHWLRALAVGDHVAQEQFAINPSDADAVIEAAFELAVARRFSTDSDYSEIASFVAGIAARFPSHAEVSYDARALIYDQVTGTTNGATVVDEERALLIKTLSVATIRDDTGMFDHELDALLAEAEKIAANRGCRPWLVPWRRRAE